MVCLKKRKNKAAISDLQLELKSVKTQSETRRNQIENRLRRLEGHQNRPGDDGLMTLYPSNEDSGGSYPDSGYYE